jgi:hypothetical protein
MRYRVTVPHVLNLLQTRLASRPGLFTPGKGHRYPLNRYVGGPQSTSRNIEKKSPFPLPGIEPRLVVCPGCRQVALQTELGLQDVSGLELE